VATSRAIAQPVAGSAVAAVDAVPATKRATTAAKLVIYRGTARLEAMEAVATVRVTRAAKLATLPVTVQLGQGRRQDRLR